MGRTMDENQGVYYHLNLPRVLLQKNWPGHHGWGGASSLKLHPIAPPRLPAGWVQLAPRLSGICGSDVSLLQGQSSPFLAPFTSFPAVLGHEVVADVVDSGQRVVVDPSLSCQARRLPPCQMCAVGRADDCLRRVDPGLGPGLLIGYNARVPGGWSQRMWVPEEQVIPIPDSMPDERAVLSEPAAIVLTGLKQLAWSGTRHALVIGSGTLGLLAMALISALYPAVEIFAVARYAAQQRMATLMGADRVVAHPTADREFLHVVGTPWQTIAGYPPHYPHGFDVVVVAAGSDTALASGIRWVAPHGQVLLLGGTGVARVDWTPIWSRRIRVYGSYGYGESSGDTFRAVLSLFSIMAHPLESLVTHQFPLARYAQAVKALGPRQGAIKVAFTPNPERLARKTRH